MAKKNKQNRNESGEQVSQDATVYGADEHGNVDEQDATPAPVEEVQHPALKQDDQGLSVQLRESVDITEAVHAPKPAQEAVQLQKESAAKDENGVPLAGQDLGPSGYGGLDGAAGVRPKISPEENNLKHAHQLGAPLADEGAYSLETLRLMSQQGTLTEQQIERLAKMEEGKEAADLARSQGQRDANHAVQVKKAQEKAAYEQKLAARRAERESERLEAEKMSNAEAQAEGFVALCKIDPRDSTTNFYAGRMQTACKSLGLEFKVTDAVVEGSDGSVTFQVLWVKPGDLEKVAVGTNSVTQLPKRAEQAVQVSQRA